MNEEGIEFTVPKGIFYNPNMKFCRSISSLAVGATGRKLELCDAFTASGIRGIRYAVENKNVKSVTFIDIDSSAIKAVKKNAKAAGLKFKAVKGNISRLVFDITADFVEVDPFGSPSPYLYDVMRLFNPLKEGYLSLTATDVAVLCGAKIKAALKNYHSKPLNNEFTHETGLRILIKKAVEVAAEFNFGVEPLFSVSDRHYLKTVLKLTRGADAADNSLRQLGYINYCKKCGSREVVKFPKEKCSRCKEAADYAGPLWIGELHNVEFVDKMQQLNKKRSYGPELATKLELLKGEVGMPPYYYDLHVLSGKFSKGHIPRLIDFLQQLNAAGYKAVKTHFSPVAIKTTAPYGKIISLIQKGRK